MRNNQRKKRVF